MLSAFGRDKVFQEKDELTKIFGLDFFVAKHATTFSAPEIRDVHGYPTNIYPFNPVYNVQTKLPQYPNVMINRLAVIPI